MTRARAWPGDFSHRALVIVERGTHFGAGSASNSEGHGMHHQSTRLGEWIRAAAVRSLGAVAVTAVAVTGLTPETAAVAATTVTTIGTAPVDGALVPIDIKVVKATGLLKSKIVDGVKDGLGRSGIYSLKGLESPLADANGAGLNEAVYGADSVVGKQWKPKYGRDYETVLRDNPGKIEDAPGGVRITSGTDRIERTASGLHSETELDRAVLDLAQLSDDASAVLGLTGDDARVLTVERIRSTAESTSSDAPIVHTEVTGLKILGEAID
ncbi:MAG: hypothetical protein J0H64_09040, partial [Actinobacteria bacterium]|nr:hypothetical protein [Actinomycetota bacterium]